MEHDHQAREPHRRVSAREAFVRQVAPQLRRRLADCGGDGGFPRIVASLQVLQLDQVAVAQARILDGERLEADVREALGQLEFGVQYEMT